MGTPITNVGTCTATFIGCRSVVTAAHCVCDASGTGAACGVGEFIMDPAQAVVFVPEAGVFPIGAIRIPPNFAFGVAGDIAVLDLDFEARGLCPRPINEVARPVLGTMATLVGFGRSSEDAGDVGIKRAGAVLTTNCSGSSVPDATHLCWNFQLPLGPPGTGSNTCPGDSGGPLLVDLGAGVAIAGVHSGGDGSCDGGGSSFDTDVFVERNWLRSQAGVDLDRTRCGDGAQVGDAAVTSLAFAGTDFSQWVQPFQVSPGTKVLRVGLNGTAIGNVDLYLKPGSPPSTTDSACASAVAGSYEFCETEDPAPGTWYALVNLASGNGTRFQLNVTMLPESPAPPPQALGQILVSNFVSYEIVQRNPPEDNRAVASARERAGPRGTRRSRPGSRHRPRRESLRPGSAADPARDGRTHTRVGLRRSPVFERARRRRPR